MTVVASQLTKDMPYWKLGSSTTEYSRAAEWNSASETFAVSQVTLWLEKRGTPVGNVWIEIWNDSGGAPGSLITNGTSSSVDASSMTATTGAEETFTFSTQPTLTSGNAYYFVAKFDYSISSSNHIRWWGTDTANPSGWDAWNASSSWSWTEETSNGQYIIIEKDSAVDVSATLDTLTLDGKNPTVTVPASPTYGGNGGIAAVDANSSLDVPYPSSIAANDILILQLLSKTADNHNAITDWTKVQEVDQGTNTTSSWYWKRATGSETGDLTCTRSSSTGAFFGVISRWSGCASTGTPFEQETYTSGQSVTLSSSAITPITNMTRIVCLACVGDDAALGTLVGGNYEENFEVNSGTGTDGAFSANSFAQTTAAEEVARSGSIGTPPG